MSIPERLWRVVRGQWILAGEAAERVEAELAQAAAYREIAEALRAPAGTGAAETGPRTSPAPAALPPGEHDPMEACYELLQMNPSGGLSELDTAYRDRVAELKLEGTPPGTPHRAALEGRKAALDAAYERLRDALNTTETRFEHLEF